MNLDKRRSEGNQRLEIGLNSENQTNREPVAAPYAATSGAKVGLCPDCKGQGYDPAGLFHNGGLRRPCARCLLVGFVYTDTGDSLSEEDAIAVMRQAMNRMNERIGYLTGKNSQAAPDYQQHFGPNKEKFRGD